MCKSNWHNNTELFHHNLRNIFLLKDAFHLPFHFGTRVLFSSPSGVNPSVYFALNLKQIFNIAQVYSLYNKNICSSIPKDKQKERDGLATLFSDLGTEISTKSTQVSKPGVTNMVPMGSVAPGNTFSYTHHAFLENWWDQVRFFLNKASDRSLDIRLAVQIF